MIQFVKPLFVILDLCMIQYVKPLFVILDHCMIQFVKPRLLGTRHEFLNRFVNPISNGQHADSTQDDVKCMKQRVHILHETLAGCVQV